MASKWKAQKKKKNNENRKQKATGAAHFAATMAKPLNELTNFR